MSRTFLLSPAAVRHVQHVCQRIAARPPVDLFNASPPVDPAWLTSLSERVARTQQIAPDDVNTLARLAETYGVPYTGA